MSERVATAVDVVADGGGSATRAGVVAGGRLALRRDGPSCNARSAGDGAVDNLVELLARVWDERPGADDVPRVTCLAVSSASTPAALRAFASALSARAPSCPPLRAPLCWVVNDIVPLVTGTGARVAIVCGTGTGFAALSERGEWARASGLEYVVSDEGGGFDLGMRGLRAVVRASDGRGPATELAARARAWCGGGLDELYERVYERGPVKASVAEFAPEVLDAAGRGDPVAAGLVDDAAGELVAGMTAVAARAGIAPPVDAGYAGSLLLGRHRALEDALRTRVARLGGAYRAAPFPPEPLAAVAGLARRLADDPGVVARVPLAIPLRA